MIVLLSGFIGALLGAFVTTGFQIYRLHRDDLNGRIDELCKAIFECAQAASEYWSTDFEKDTTKNLRLAEAKILALQSLVDGLYAELRPKLIPNEARRMDVMLAELLDSVSGGDFSVSGRAVDAKRTRLSLQTASMAVVALRRASSLTIPFSRLARAYYENRSRQLDLPEGW